MSGSDANDRYTLPAILLHWLIALGVVAMVALGWWMQTIPKDPVGPRANAFNLHKSIGMTIFVLMIVRLAWRSTHRPPPLPAMPRWQERAAHIVHATMYVCLFLQPLTGYLGSAVSGYPVKYFGVVLPAWAPKNIPLKEFLSVVHLVNSWVLVGAVTLHTAAALKHQFVDRDGLIGRMWPWPARPGAVAQLGQRARNATRQANSARETR